jgi:hypothetical protein
MQTNRVLLSITARMAVIEEKTVNIWNLENVQACDEDMKLAS